MKKKHLTGLFLCLALGSVYLVRQSITARSTEPIIDAEEKVGYETIQDSRAKETLQDIKILSAFAAESAGLVPESMTVLGVEVKALEFVKPIIHCVYNAAEFGLAIMKFNEEDKGSLGRNVKCLGFSDKMLKDASGEAQRVDAEGGKLPTIDAKKEGKFDIGECKALGCGNKRLCVAILIVRVTNFIKPLFDNAVVKYLPDSGDAQRGFILNIDYLLKEFINLAVSTGPVKKYFEGRNKQELFGKWLERIDTVRQIITSVGKVFSGLLEVTNLFAVAIDPQVVRYLDPQLQKRANQVIQEAQQEPVIDDEELDDIYDDLDEDGLELD